MVCLNRYCQIVSEKNAIKRSLYAHFCLQTNENFENCIFIDECKVEIEIHSLIK